MAKICDLFEDAGEEPRGRSKQYTAKDIEVLEGLEPVRRRPGMYIGGTDEARAAPSGGRDRRQRHGRSRGRPCHPHRDRTWQAGDVLTVARQWPRHSRRPASQVQEQVGAGSDHDHAACRRKIRRQGLRHVAAACTASAPRVVNALSEWMEVDVARDKRAHTMRFERGKAVGKAERSGRGQPARHDRLVQARRQDFRRRVRIFRRRSFTAWRSPRPICSAAWKSAGHAIHVSHQGRNARRRRC